MAAVSTLENETRTFLRELEDWSHARLISRPSPTGWSALQVVEHLVKTEEEILVLARQGAQTPHRIGLRDRLGFIFIKRVFQTDRRVKTPGSAAHVLPGPEMALPGLRERWQKTRTDFQLFKEELSEKQAQQGLFRHPVIGWMGIQQITEFFWVPIVHHRFQIERLRAQLLP